MTAAGAAAGTAAAAAERQFRLDHEAHIAHVDLNATDALQKGAFDAESETVDFEGFVVFSRLIQSQCETRTASATGGKIDTNARLGLIREESLKFSTSRIGKIDHLILQLGFVYLKIGTHSDFVKAEQAYLSSRNELWL